MNNIQNGEIRLCARLSMAIRWFVGGDRYDISQNHGVSTNEVMKSVWTIVDLVKMCEQIKINFPSIHADQEKVADGFKKKSWVEFDNCEGCVNGMLVWITKPSNHVIKDCNIGAGIFFRGRGEIG